MSTPKKILFLFVLSGAGAFSFIFFSTIFKKGEKMEQTVSKPKENLPKWDLNELYKGLDDPKIKTDLNEIESDINKFSAAYTDKINTKLKDSTLLNSIRAYESIQNRIQKIAVYARLHSFLNLDNPEIQAFFQKTIESLTLLGQKLIFFTLDINKLSEETVQSLLKNNKELSFYRPWLRKVRVLKQHQLDEKLEQLLSEKNITSNQMWSRLFDESLAKLRFKYDSKELGVAAITNLQSNPDEKIRKESTKIIAEKLKENGNIFVTIINVLAKDLEINDRWRNFKNLGDSRHLANDVESDVIENLKKTVKENYKNISHRFYKIKAKLLGVDKISYWDRNAPLPFSDEKHYKWEEAKTIVLAAYKSFDKRIYTEVKKFFDNEWIDAEESPKKYSGAFNMPTFQGHHPYVLLNYKGKHRDVTTLAHEIGHGIHSTLADHQGILMANAPLTLCETASVFGEMLTFRHLLEQAKDKVSRIKILENKISDMVNTVVRQIAFYDFEYQLHEQRRKGKELSREEINTIWMNTQHDALGSYVELSDDIKEFWMLIPHFIHSPFYVYAYAFGDCLVNSLYKYFQDNPEGFQDKYIEMLQSGGTKHHKELLSPFGLNASNPDFWQKGLDVISDLLEQLEKELNQIQQ